MQFEKSCGAVVFCKIEDAWNVLLIRHERGRHTSFPKGHVESGETERQTAEREIFEETGIRVCVDEKFRAENRYMTRPEVEKLVVFFIAVTQAQEPIAQPGEVALAAWAPMPEARKRLTYEHDREILDRAYQYLLENA